LYEDYKANEENIKITNEEVDKLNLEIEYRFSQVLVKLYELSNDSIITNKTTNANRMDQVKKAALGIGNSKNSENTFLFSEYSDWSLLALLADEKRLEDHLGRNTDRISRVIGHISGLKVFYEVRNVDFTDANKIAGHIQEEMWLGDWKFGGFYFSEGSIDNPFP
jgi:hypothetical protein